jgi:hypothetical protein
VREFREMAWKAATDNKARELRWNAGLCLARAVSVFATASTGLTAAYWEL